MKKDYLVSLIASYLEARPYFPGKNTQMYCIGCHRTTQSILLIRNDIPNSAFDNSFLYNVMWQLARKWDEEASYPKTAISWYCSEQCLIYSIEYNWEYILERITSL